MKWKQSGNTVETQWKQTGLNWKQKNVSSCFQLFPLDVSSGNALIMGLLRLCFHCFHFFKRAYIEYYIFSFGVWFYSTSGNYKSLINRDLNEKALKIDFKVSFFYAMGISIDKQQISKIWHISGHAEVDARQIPCWING